MASDRGGATAPPRGLWVLDGQAGERARGHDNLDCRAAVNVDVDGTAPNDDDRCADNDDSGDGATDD